MNNFPKFRFAIILKIINPKQYNILVLILKIGNKIMFNMFLRYSTLCTLRIDLCTTQVNRYLLQYLKNNKFSIIRSINRSFQNSNIHLVQFTPKASKYTRRRHFLSTNSQFLRTGIRLLHLLLQESQHLPQCTVDQLPLPLCQMLRFQSQTLRNSSRRNP